MTQKADICWRLKAQLLGSARRSDLRCTTGLAMPKKIVTPDRRSDEH
jgi:hypothetical protein